MTGPTSPPPVDRAPECPALRTRGPHPWRLVDEGEPHADLVFERTLRDSAGRALGPSREIVRLEGAGLAPWPRLALAGYVLLGKLSPADVGAWRRTPRWVEASIHVDTTDPVTVGPGG